MSSTTKTSILIFIAIIGSTLAKAPKYVIPCRKSDRELNSCIRNSFNHLKNYLPKGIPELGIPPLDPLEIDELKMEYNSSSVKGTLRLSNTVVKGARSYTVKEVRADVKKLRLDLILDIPRLKVAGRYDVSGNVMHLPFRSHGNFWAGFSDINVLAKHYGQVQRRGRKSFIFIKKVDIDFTIKEPKFKIDDKGDAAKEISKAVNQYLKENAKILVENMRPFVSKTIAKHVKKTLNKAFSKIELKYWLMD